jgi:uncharacterized membrane protein YraQ (UPF0718 family)
MNANVIGNVIVPFVLFLILVIWNGLEGGSTAILQGFTATYKMLLGVAIVVIIAFLITGQVQVLVGRHMTTVVEFLNGRHGVWGSTGAGIITPTLSVYPVVQELWQKGLAPIGVILSVIITARLLNFQTILFFLPFLGWELTLISIGTSTVVVIFFVLVIEALS